MKKIFEDKFNIGIIRNGINNKCLSELYDAFYNELHRELFRELDFKIKLIVDKNVNRIKS